MANRSKIPKDPHASITRLFKLGPEEAMKKLRQMDFEKLKALHSAQQPLWENSFRVNVNTNTKAALNAKIQASRYMLIHQAAYERTTGNLKMNAEMQHIFDYSVETLKNPKKGAGPTHR